MKNKIIIGLLVLGALIGAGFIVWGSNSSTTSDFGAEPTYQADRLVLQGSDGDVSIADIYKLTSDRLPENTIIFLKDPDFEVMYSPETQGFAITALARDLKSVASRAESKLVQTLDISTEQACTLDIWISVPYSINPDLSGRQYKLPSCS
ncbi:MAG: hypothetical protein COW24_02420 [Candidatus Kerfeldbacteria bacterium CG15_BIG_FIL_POST_REV_8_21_14_020_45_12]|uniref:Uncharacterized protein n=1 Tax=Candidatus Kerfeldbacteria bacterium CG15_BIG_FIL_POST_REV_8_21_14_020_45_12 TaxID=2014247 RepID=A0A2M7H444_9BACT|nr:MAG: hypothetical protein COW24_02420 [Candidatus Kerfeldbacteria bacterium CG15_BIG_FIL_POST_REV_8_21_14_020_45_12]PJA92865.1 MAG: hypothetical protein CO132_05705 [Candidatus Kerfeldbacteria bacterium CG_4_9_14_3_um_filter_45_8]